MEKLFLKTDAVCFALLLSLGIFASHPAWAQSKAIAPDLDKDLRAYIHSLRPLNDKILPEMKGKVVVVTFFASWCPPCRPEFAEINSLRRSFANNAVTLVAINLFEDAFKDPGGFRMQGFLKDTKPLFSVLGKDKDGIISRRFGGIDRIPTVYIYDRSGKPAFTFIHQRNAKKTHTTAKELLPVVRKLLNGAS